MKMARWIKSGNDRIKRLVKMSVSGDMYAFKEMRVNHEPHLRRKLPKSIMPGIPQSDISVVTFSEVT